MEILILHILILNIVSVTTNGLPPFWEVMENLQEFNHRSLQWSAKNSRPFAKTPQTTQNPLVSPNVQTTTATPTKQNIADQASTNTLDTARTTLENMTDNKPTPTIHANNNIDSTIEPTVISSNIIYAGKSQFSQNQQVKSGVIQSDFNFGNVLIYCGVVGGIILASTFIIVFVVVRRKRSERIAKGRFNVTDQKTYKDTKIFVMANGIKSDSIVNSFDAIPTDYKLWQELQSNTSSVF